LAKRPTSIIVLSLAIACRQPPKQAEHAPDPGPERREVRLAEEAVRAAGLEVVAVSREAFHPHVIASGVIRPEVERSVAVRARVPGRVVQVMADVGDRVRAGQTLATLEGPDASAVLSRYRAAAAREVAARRSLERAERLLEIRGISRAERDAREAEARVTAAETAAARQDVARFGVDADVVLDADRPLELGVSAPLGGTVLERAVSPGLLVDRNATLFVVANLARVWAVADVYEKDLGQVQEQGEVEVRSDAFPDAVFTGRIALIEPVLDDESRTAHARVVLDNASGTLRPGLFVTVAIPLKGASEVEATAVPAEAVQKISGLPAVFVETGPGRFELRPVETGREAHGMVEVRHGLKDGERVVSRGSFVLKSELLKGSIGGEDH
jgi:cobalt-zinc-cadmium efflux system membrane fusion protein